MLSIFSSLGMKKKYNNSKSNSFLLLESDQINYTKTGARII